jgi:hypothetical protein
VRHRRGPGEGGEPRREELEAIVLRYRRVAPRRPARGTTARRRRDAATAELTERFERRLEEWLPDPELQQEWRAFMFDGAAEPELPPPVRPLVFRGRSELSGSLVEVRGEPDDLTVEVDGSLVERVVGERDFAARRPPLRFRVVDADFLEIFAASAPALQALADYRDELESPPWEFAPELFEDGLIQVRFDLTPRGHRALASGATAPP